MAVSKCPICNEDRTELFLDETVVFRGVEMKLEQIGRLRCVNPSCPEEDSFTAKHMAEAERQIASKLI